MFFICRQKPNAIFIKRLAKDRFLGQTICEHFKFVLVIFLTMTYIAMRQTKKTWKDFIPIMLHTVIFGKETPQC